MKKLLGLLAMAPMAVAACGGTEVKAATAYGSTHGGAELTDADSGTTKVETGIAKVSVEVNGDNELSKITIDETGRPDGYVWTETYDKDTMDSYGFRILSSTEATGAMDDYSVDVEWKYGTDYMPVCVDAGAEDDCGDDDTTDDTDESADDTLEAQGWTKSMDALSAYFMGVNYEKAVTQHALLLANGTTPVDWVPSDITGASEGLKHVHHYSAVLVEAFKQAVGE